MKAGRLSFMLPKPYEAQAPIEGRPATWLPEQKKVMAGSWLIASVCIVRMTQRSSATSPVWLSRSLYSTPDFPYFLKFVNAPASGSVAW